MNEIMDRLLQFIDVAHKFVWWQIIIICCAIIFVLFDVFYLIIKKYKRERLIDKIIDKVNPKIYVSFVIISILIIGLAIVIIANKNYHDCKVDYYPYLIEPSILKWSDTVYNLSYIFENKSDLPSEINDISFFISLSKKGILESNLDSMGRKGIFKFPLDSEIVKLRMPAFKLSSGGIDSKSVPLSLDYLRQNKHIEIVTTCLSVRNPERISLKTEICWDTTKQDSPFSIKYEPTYDRYFDKIPIQENVVYKWKPETTNEKIIQLKIAPLSNKYIPKVSKDENRETKEVKVRRKLSESTYQEHTTISSTSRRKLSGNVIDSNKIEQRRKLRESK